MPLKRLYQSVIEKHLDDYQQIVVLEGPMMVGKTSLSKVVTANVREVLALNWDISSDRELILAGPEKIYSKINVDNLNGQLPILLLVNLHLYKDWKNLLKGYYDALSDRCKIIVITGEKTDIYRSGQDSMMGRYFSYHIHPFSVAEICERSEFSKEYALPKNISQNDWDNLLNFGGFPQPFEKATKSFHTRWSNNFRHTVIADVGGLSKVNDLQRLELFSQLLI